MAKNSTGGGGGLEIDLVDMERTGHFVLHRRLELTGRTVSDSASVGSACAPRRRLRRPPGISIKALPSAKHSCSRRRGASFSGLWPFRWQRPMGVSISGARKMATAFFLVSLCHPPTRHPKRKERKKGKERKKPPN